MDDELHKSRSISAGGPAGHSKRSVSLDDRIIAVAKKQTNDRCVAWRLDDVVDMIRGERDTTVFIWK